MTDRPVIKRVTECKVCPPSMHGNVLFTDGHSTMYVLNNWGNHEPIIEIQEPYLIECVLYLAEKYPQHVEKLAELFKLVEDE